MSKMQIKYVKATNDMNETQRAEAEELLDVNGWRIDRKIVSAGQARHPVGYSVINNRGEEVGVGIARDDALEHGRQQIYKPSPRPVPEEYFQPLVELFEDYEAAPQGVKYQNGRVANPEKEHMFQILAKASNAVKQAGFAMTKEQQDELATRVAAIQTQPDIEVNQSLNTKVGPREGRMYTEQQAREGDF